MNKRVGAALAAGMFGLGTLAAASGTVIARDAADGQHAAAMSDCIRLAGDMPMSGMAGGMMSMMGGSGAMGPMMGGSGAMGPMMGGSGAMGPMMGGSGAMGPMMGGSGAMPGPSAMPGAGHDAHHPSPWQSGEPQP